MPSASPPATPTVAVFDLGGVLVDWNPRYLFSQLFDDTARLEWFLANVCNGAFFRRLDIESDSRAAAAELQARHPEHAAEIATYVERFDETIRGEFAVMAALLERLHAGGTRLYALTNWAADTFAQTRGRLPSLSLFRDIVVSGEERLIKPDPRLFEVLFRRGGFAPTEAVFIDDNAANAEAAQALGMHAIHHREPDTTIAALRALGLPA
ncbi:MAG: HAD-IA family hydrolase [Alphaproteobacteria bacterium]|nr:HAD-IA family hydrolase [Alphaproteobacteria bacterium]